MRVGIVGILHESNTFIDSPTTLAHFRADVFLPGEADETHRRFADAPHEIGGFFAGLESEGIEAVPLLAARATPGGVIQSAVFERLKELVDEGFAANANLDGLLVACHGAAVSQPRRDADGEWLAQVRSRIGSDKPVIATLDLHANLSRRMVDAADALIGYRTNPHVDQRERGIEAARLMARTLSGEVKPTMAAAFPRVAINIEKQLTAEPPCRPLYDMADEMLREPMVLSNSVLLGFPYADVPEMGSSVVVVTDNQPQLAQQLADQIAGYIETNRHQFAGAFLSVEEAVRQAAMLDGPVLLLDMGDNVGGGSPGDGTALADAILEQAIDANLAADAFICLADPQAAHAAVQAGRGARLRLSMGGKVETSQGPPLTAEVEVLSLHDGKFSESAVTHGGITEFDQGPTAVVRADKGLTIMLTSERIPPFSLRQMTAFGLNPAQFQAIIAKGVHAPRAAYDSVCQHCLRVDTPGVTQADMTKLEYQQRRRPLFPFEELPDV